MQCAEGLSRAAQPEALRRNPGPGLPVAEEIAAPHLRSGG